MRHATRRGAHSAHASELSLSLSLSLSPLSLSHARSAQVPLEKRFAFYDQVHTTGMDIKQTSTAVAVVTVGKDMSFRDYAQGSFRMRGIGKGQTLHVVLIPEVAKVIEQELSLVPGLFQCVAMRSGIEMRLRLLARDERMDRLTRTCINSPLPPSFPSSLQVRQECSDGRPR